MRAYVIFNVFFLVSIVFFFCNFAVSHSYVICTPIFHLFQRDCCCCDVNAVSNFGSSYATTTKFNKNKKKSKTTNIEIDPCNCFKVVCLFVLSYFHATVCIGYRKLFFWFFISLEGSHTIRYTHTPTHLRFVLSDISKRFFTVILVFPFILFNFLFTFLFIWLYQYNVFALIGMQSNNVFDL